jgi:hypothetical protein
MLEVTLRVRDKRLNKDILMTLGVTNIVEKALEARLSLVRTREEERGEQLQQARRGSTYVRAQESPTPKEEVDRWHKRGSRDI